MTKAKRFGSEPGEVAILALAALFFLVCTSASYARWAEFRYRTFDLAFYTQAMWQFIHGRFQVSVINAPFLGNHVEPIVFLLAPLFAVLRHPMIFVVVQNAALATMGPVGFDFAKRLGFDGKASWLLATGLLVAPAAGYIALHEFHSEALTALLLLLMLRAHLIRSLAQHWLWFIAVLACKENMAPLLAVYCVVHFILERKRRLTELRAWYLWPFAVSVLWFLFCTQVITPALNSRSIDYVGLYDRIGGSAGNILLKAMTRPQLVAGALGDGLTHGNLVWGLLLPFLCLPLLRPRWLLISTPILLQHLLSWRSSERTIYFHYAAPLLPLFWIATVEAAATLKIWESALARRALSLLLILACIAAQVCLGPASALAATTADWFSDKADRARRNAFIARIPAEASVVAPFPYLSHLAMREKLYSLHHILKGLKTLSRSSYPPPPPTDFVLLDYGDSATFDAGSGYYHPIMKMVDGQIIPSSDALLHNFLKQCSWATDSFDELTLLSRRERAIAPDSSPLVSGHVADFGTHTQLISITKSGGVLSDHESLEIKMAWMFQAERDVFPWMFLRLARLGSADRAVLTKGLCGPEVASGLYEEQWHITSADGLAEGDYSVEAVFVDNCKRAWLEATGQGNWQTTLLSRPIPLGNVRVSTRKAIDR